MIRFTVVLMLALVPVAYNQLISFKDGKVGVNFLGYHAEAGLGGLLTGNAAHGGLSASAGTPFGQRAGAGLGGTVDSEGRPRGGGFAAATAGNGIGASAALGGQVDEYGGSGGLGSEAHGIGYSAKRVELTQFPQQVKFPEQSKSVDFVKLPAVDQRSSFADDAPETPAVQPLPSPQYGRRYYKNQNSQVNNRVNEYDAPENNYDYRNFFDSFGFFSNLGASIANAPHPASQTGNAIIYNKQKGPNTVELQKFVIPDTGKKEVKAIRKEARRRGDYSNRERFIVKSFAARSGFNAAPSVNTDTAAHSTTQINVRPNPNFFNDIFNIPISTLTAVNQFLNNGFGNGAVSVTKTKTVNSQIQHGTTN